MRQIAALTLSQQVMQTQLLAILFFFIFFQLTLTTRNEHIRHVMFYEYSNGSTVAVAASNINRVYGEGSATERTCQRWFARFNSGDTTLEDKPRSGGPMEANDQALIDLLNDDRRQTTRELGEQLGLSHGTIENHLHSLGFS